MKTLYTILFSLALFSTVSGQTEWQEFLSHERSLISPNGHLLINDTLHIAYNDGLKKITGNHKPATLLKHNPYMYQRIKTTRTGIDSKELLLLEAFDYDISGIGLVSLRNENGYFWGKDQFGYEEFGFEYQQVPDGIISPSNLIYDQIINYNDDLVKLENGMIETTSPSPVQAFHEGLNNTFFAIKGDSLMNYSDTGMTPVLYLGSYDELLNDPYTNSLVIKLENLLHWYSFDDFSLTKTLAIQPNSIGIQFIEDGFYQLAKTDTDYLIYKFPSSETPAFETIYTLSFAEAEFGINSFEISGQDLYFIGSKNIGVNNNGITFHYAQKRTFDQPFAPERQDLAIDSFSVVEVNESEWQTHTYTCQVRNNGTSPINSFAVSTPILPIFYHDFSYIRMHFDTLIAPGETFTFSGYANLISDPSQLSIKVLGVNYGFDNNNDNDQYTADIISLSDKDITKLNLDIYPNPSSDILNLKGDISNQSTIHIYDVSGQIVNYNRLSFDRIDISKLPIGIYNLVVTTNSSSKTIAFTKN